MSEAPMPLGPVRFLAKVRVTVGRILAEPPPFSADLLLLLSEALLEVAHTWRLADERAVERGDPARLTAEIRAFEEFAAALRALAPLCATPPRA
jgi:hypothetical protein